MVGLGPSDERLLTAATRELLTSAPVARLRTRRHPAANAFPDIASYDQLYDEASSFEELYEKIAEDLVALAAASPDQRVIYAVPGSPVVAERTVEILAARTDVRVIREPAVSVIELACAVLGRDPMNAQLRIVDALATDEPLRGPGPLLVLQTYSGEVLSILASRLPAETKVIVLHHLGLPDEEVLETTASALVHFANADHLTSVWIGSFRTAGDAMDDLVALTTSLRQRCVWDQEQTHESLIRHLLEESYEAIDALERYAAASALAPPGTADATEVVEELGDLLFQISFHAELGHEDDQFDFAAIADGVTTKLISRHPHVFADANVANARDAATQWELLKRDEKQRTSVTDGVPLQLPSLALYDKLRRKAGSIGLAMTVGVDARDRAITSLDALRVTSERASETVTDIDADPEWAELLSALSDLARWCGVDLEAVLRRRSLTFRDEIIAFEQKLSST